MFQESYNFDDAYARAQHPRDKKRIEALFLRAQGWEFEAIAEEVGCHISFSWKVVGKSDPI